MKQRIYLTSDNKVVVETDNGRIQNGETETTVKGEFAISADDVNTLRVALNDEVLARVKRYTLNKYSRNGTEATVTEITYGRDKGIEALMGNIEELTAEKNELKQLEESKIRKIQTEEKGKQESLKREYHEVAIQLDSLAPKMYRLKNLSLWDRIFNWKKQINQ